MQRPSISRLMRTIPRTRPLLARCKLTHASGGFLGVATRHHFTASVLAQRPADLAWIVQRTAPALQSVRLLSSASTDGNSESEQMREVRIGAAYEKGQIDPSSSVTIHPPVGHDENTELAQQLGIFKCAPFHPCVTAFFVPSVCCSVSGCCTGEAFVTHIALDDEPEFLTTRTAIAFRASQSLSRFSSPLSASH